MSGDNTLIPKHGGYRKLKSFQLAQLIYDLTVRFCNRYVDKNSRTRDQMIQAARSGTQNIAEGSQASGTSKKMELKLTNVARASLEEFRLDYEDFLRQRGLEVWTPGHAVLVRFRKRRWATLDEVRAWVEEERRRPKNEKGRKLPNTIEEHRRTQTDTDGGTVSNRTEKVAQQAVVRTNMGREGSRESRVSLSVRESPCQSVPSSALVANAALSLLNLCVYFLDRQIAAQAKAFEDEGGFTERLYQRRTSRKRGK
ncbi:MAG: four helix bundle protein [Candidatus Abyssobacteria bacterium SURF_5]|uniref:Four helix bundle protein n=1 Tax=Abyssobacteria bacterium (strain SURF_5) TaxID=2093360 RepID=A0A3A4P5V3_ABYX5|nr:MAG: four helix bundle protein [Candidatus Abyssubacteria bacterium SURF_5]